MRSSKPRPFTCWPDELHNFCVDMNRLPWPLIPKRQWPAVRFKDKRAITWEEHCKIVERERNPGRQASHPPLRLARDTAMSRFVLPVAGIGVFAGHYLWKP